MIYLLRKHDIISVPPYAAGIYHRTKVRYHIEDISPVPTGTGIIESSPTGGWRDLAEGMSETTVSCHWQLALTAVVTLG